MKAWEDLTEVEKTDRARFHVIGLKESVAAFAARSGASVEDIEKRCAEDAIPQQKKTSMLELHEHLKMCLKVVESDMPGSLSQSANHGVNRLGRLLGISYERLRPILNWDPETSPEFRPTARTVTRIMNVTPDDLRWVPDAELIAELTELRKVSRPVERGRIEKGQKGRYADHLITKLGWNRRQVSIVLELSYSYVGRILDDKP